MMHKFKKSLGQHFLINKNIVNKIIDKLEIEDKIVLEIGPGDGVLTDAILKRSPQKLICIEKDSSLIDTLKNKFLQYDNFFLHNEDAMNIDYLSLLEKKRFLVISNLPYNVGIIILLNIINYIEYVDSITVMLQKEVVDRICATPKTKAYGKISVLIQSLCDITKICDVSPNNFYPRPKVNSSVIKLIKKDTAISRDQYIKLKEFCTIAFSAKRKILKNTLKKHNVPIFNNLITDTTRAEEMSVGDFLAYISQNN